MKVLKANSFFIVWQVFYLSMFAYLFRNTINIFYGIVIIELVSLIIALSPLGELLLRVWSKARGITMQREIAYLQPIFSSVYEDISRVYPNTSKNIKLYIEDAEYINGYAIGSNTIVLTRGAIETYNEQELKGVLAHEFGHIVNGDTKILLLAFIGNGVFTLLFFAFALVLDTITFLLKILNGCCLFGLLSLPLFLIQKILYWFGKSVMSLMYIMLAFGKRKNEYNADQFAFEAGYGEELLSSLYLEYEININMSMSLIEKLKTDHPYLTKRITKLEHLLADH